MLSAEAPPVGLVCDEYPVQLELNGEPVVTLRCGVARPPAFLATAEVQDINGVIWFPERRGAQTAWTAVDRPVYVEVVAPADDASSAVARLSTPLSRALPEQDLDPVPN